MADPFFRRVPEPGAAFLVRESMVWRGVERLASGEVLPCDCDEDRAGTELIIGRMMCFFALVEPHNGMPA